MSKKNWGKRLGISAIALFSLLFLVPTLSWGACGWNIVAQQCAQDSNPYGAFCDIADCYCGPFYIDTGNFRIARCRQPAWICPHCCMPNLLSDAIWEYRCTDTPPLNGDLGGNTPPCKAKGAPVWEVNKVNLNLYIVDTPLWYKPAVGPSVDLTMSYNSKATVDTIAPFGSKWTFNYGTYLTADVAGNATIVMPDGRVDVFNANAQGGYTKPFEVFNTLTKTGAARYELAFLDGTVYIYDTPPGGPAGRSSLVAIRNAYNQSLTFTYSAGNLAAITDAQNRVTTFAYTGNGRGLIQSVTDPFGRSTVFEYDPATRLLTKATDMGGYVTNYTYETVNGETYLASITNPKGTWVFKTEPNDSATSPANYPDPNAAAPKMGKKYRLTITHPNNNKEEYFYDGYNAWHVSPNDYVTYVDATTNNREKAVKTRFYFDRSIPKGKLAQTISYSGTVSSSTYDPVTGRIATSTDGNNRSTKYEYNSNGLVSKVWDAKTPTTSAPTTAMTYYANSIDLQKVTTGLGDVQYEYNTAHDVTRITDRMGAITELTYTTEGQLATVTEAKGTADQRLTELIYDSGTRLLSEIRRAGISIAALTYDTIGRTKTVTYPDGVIITYDYDNLNQTKTVTYPDGKSEVITQSQLCPNMVDSVTDRGGRTTSYQYDALKRLIQRSGPDGIYQYGYDANSNMTTLTDPRNKVTTFGYDKDNKLIKKTYADGKYLSYTYDPAGLLKTIVNARNQSTTYTYDENNNLTAITYPSGTPSVGYTYDPYNRRITRTDGVGSFTYSYDANNRLTDVKYPWDGGSVTVHYDYNALNQLKTLTPIGSSPVSYTYDTAGRLKTIKRGTDTVPFTYDYTTAASSLVQKLTRPNGSYTEYEYNDPLKRLTAILNRNSAGAIITKYEYTYNNLDLKDTETITGASPLDNLTDGTTTYTPNDVNQIVSSTNPNRTYTYDNDGNMTTGFTPEGYPLALSYDAASRLIKAEYTDSGNTVHKTEYTYDGDDLLAIMKKTIGTSITETRYIRAGFLPIQERDANNAITREYLWGQDMGGGIGGLLNLRQSGADYNYLYDGKGNVTSLIDSAQATVAQYVYDPFGRVMKKTGTLDQPFQFSTKQYDAETGHNYYGYRFYSPQLGRWINRDPIEEAGGVNMYQAMGNNPVNWIDPSGLLIWVCSRPTKAGLFNHAYIYDDVTKTCCGMGSTSQCSEKGPNGGDSCRPIVGSSGKEDVMMKCCKKTADNGIWTPVINDCHEAVDFCSSYYRFKNPGAPGGRVGACESCWIQKKRGEISPDPFMQ